MKKVCEQCGIEYDCRPVRAHISRFHSVRCRCDWEKEHGRITITDDERKKRKKDPQTTYTCIGCGKDFKASKYAHRKYCTRECGMSSIGKQSNPTWNTGLTIEDPRVKAMSEKVSKTLKHRYKNNEIKSWNKGLTVETDIRVANYVKTQTQWRNTDSFDKEKWRESMRKGQVKAWAEGKYDCLITSPEQKVWDHLVSLGHNVKWFKDISEDDALNTWYFQFPFKDAFVPDFACPDLQLIIEADGCAIHAHDPQKCDRNIKYGVTNFGLHNAKRDREKHHLYHKHGWKWANVWQCEAEKNDFHRIHRELGI